MRPNSALVTRRAGSLPRCARFLKSGCCFLPLFLMAFATAFWTASRMRLPTSTVRSSSSLRRRTSCAGVSAANSAGVHPKRAAAHAQSRSALLGPRSGPGSPSRKYS